MIEIPLSKQGKHKGKYTAIVDECDADLAELRWSIVNPENLYARHLNNGKIQLLHRIILERILGRGLKENEFPDHVNYNTLDNRRENLRLATRSQNRANTQKQRNNKSGYKGVSWSKKARKWVAQIDSVHIGYFNTPEEAHVAYCEKAKELFGEFARFN